MTLRSAIAAARRNERKQARAASVKLTPSQQRILDSLKDGRVRYVVQRLDRPVRRLRDLGLIKAELIVEPDSKRGSTLFWRIAAADATYPSYDGAD